MKRSEIWINPDTEEHQSPTCQLPPEQLKVSNNRASKYYVPTRICYH